MSPVVKQELVGLVESSGPGHATTAFAATVPFSKSSTGKSRNRAMKVARSGMNSSVAAVASNAGPVPDEGGVVGCSQLMRARPSSELAATRRNADFMAPSVIGSSAVRRAPERTTQFNAQDRYRRWPGSHSFGDLDHTRLGRTQAGHCTARNAFTLPFP